MLEFRTHGFCGYAVKYSPFFDSRIAVATSANYGLVGNGRLYVLGLTAEGVAAERWYETQDSIFDLAWSEAHENQLLTAGGDGSLKLFDSALPADAAFPVRAWPAAHAREVFSVHWNLVGKDSFLSSSWDGTVKVWRPDVAVGGGGGGVGSGGNMSSSDVPVATFNTGTCTYSAQFSPHAQDILACVGSDSTVRVYDLRVGAGVVAGFAIHGPAGVGGGIGAVGGGGGGGGGKSQPSEALTLDWNKYRDSVIATAGVDRTIRTFDVRKAAAGALSEMRGHEYAIRKISWSPHRADVLLSASYDMTCRVWLDGSGSAGSREAGRMGRHTEFVTGVDWCLFGAEGWSASCGWDERVLIWNAAALMG